MAALNERWQKPTRSGNNGQCVEARFVDGVVEVRNSNHPEAGVVRFTRAEWETFIVAVDADGEFRLP
jgi:hypothetical protein